MTDVAIATSDLTKSYDSNVVLDGVDLSVTAGSVHALLGPNGAGKTTTVRILATLLAPDGGRATVAGHDVVRQRREVRRRISLTGQYVALDELQTGTENLRMMARLAGLAGGQLRATVGGLLERFDLTEAARRPVKSYSGGMRRRLDLAASLVSAPSVLFLDEPTTGLDVRSRQAMWAVVSELTAEGVTVLLTTQYLEEADQLADRIGVLDGGRIVADGTAAELKQQVAQQRIELAAADSGAFEVLRRTAGQQVSYADPATRVIEVPTDGSAAHVRAVLDQLDPGRDRIQTFTVRTATLDDAFLALTGHDAGAPTIEDKEAAGV